jgi:NitT/TauT family transport system ATP-binding protein
MRQRVNIARVIAARPRILLMDEPFAALDEQTRLRLGDELLNIWRETGATIMFITHGLSEAAMLSDRIIVMSARPGRVREIVTSPLPRSRTSDDIGSPAFAEVTGRLWENLSHPEKREAAV